MKCGNRITTHHKRPVSAGQEDFMQKTINIRIPEELLEELDEVIVPRERKKTGFYGLTRSEIIVRAIRELAKNK
jgi:metal-responsive CopG/Arc/MetJ family transcriptional regulator